MSNNEIVTVHATPSVLATEHAPRVGETARDAFARAAFAPNTRRAYEGAINRFRAWMLANNEQELTADAISRWISALATEGRSPSSIRQSLAAVRWAMREARLPDVGGDHVVRVTMRGIAKSHTADDSKPKDPVLRNDLERLIRALEGDDSAAAIYLRALVLVAWQSAMRRSEIAALCWRHLRWTEQGVAVKIARSKGDQTGEGTEIPLFLAGNPLLCPLTALQRLRAKLRWLTDEHDADRPVFPLLTKRGWLRVTKAAPERALLERVRELAVRAGLDPDKLGMHSFRSGFATEAARRGRDMSGIQQHLRHKSPTTTARYVKRGRLFDDSIAAGIL